MNNYKIRVNNEAESREAQELFFELGAVWGRSKKASFNSEPMSYIYFNGSTLYYGHDDENDEYWFQCESSGKELALPQLRDLVVLKRNDVKDATHTGTGDSKYYVDSNGDSYIHNSIIWTEWKLDISILKPITQTQDPALISGADALIAIGKGERVQYSFDDDKYWQNDIANLKITDFGGGHYAFRLKPRTVKLEIEVPAPFDPKYGDYVFTIDSNATDGWTKFLYQASMERKIIYGAWRTEAEIKIVVEQLHKLKGHSK